MSDYSPTPIEPVGSSSLAERADDFLSEVSDLSLAARLGWAALMMFVAWSCLWGAYSIVQLRHWISWAFALILLEPVGIAALFAAVFFVAPTSGLGRWLAGAMRRANIGMVSLLVVAVGGFVTLVAWCVWELVRQ